MGYFLQGLQLADGPIMSKFSDETSINIVEHALYGNNAVQVEIVSVSSKEIQISLPLGKAWIGTSQEVEFVANNLKGLVTRLTPLHLLSEDVPIVGNFNEVFIAVSSVNIDWKTGTIATELWATVNISALIIGPPSTLLARYAVKSSQRDGSFEGDIAGRSVVGLPAHDVSFLTRVNQIVLEERNGTVMLDLNETVNNGFANDTTSAVAFDTEIGEVTFRLDTDDLKFLENSVQVYDEGYSPRRRVYSLEHDYQGDLAIETELYRIVVQSATSQWDFYESTGTIGDYEVSPFESIEPFIPYVSWQLVLNQDEIVRVKLDSQDYLEIERGKDPVIELMDPDAGFSYTVNAPLGVQEDTSAGVNYIHIGNDVYITSNFHFSVETDRDVVSTLSTQDQVYSIMKGADVITDGRNREVLKKIS